MYHMHTNNLSTSTWNQILWLFRDGFDRKKIHQRVTDNDYFGTLATHLQILRTEIDREINDDRLATLRRFEEELIYLQRNYSILEKEEKEVLIG